MASSPVNIVSVKSMISIFENQTVNVNDEPSRLRKARSLGNLSTYPSKNHATNNNNNISIVRTSEPIYSDKNFELVQIGQQVQHLKRTLNNYKTYSKENHIYYQNQIFFLLADLVNVETKNNSEIIDNKSELMEEAKRLNKILNSRLPSEAMKVKDHANFSATKVTKYVKEEAKVPQKIEKREEMEEIEYHKETKIDSTTEEDAPVPSVKNLKKLFERNSSVTDVPVPDRNRTQITRKFKTFNGTSDAKYVPYSERFKSKETDLSKEEEIQVRNDLYEKSSKFDDDDAEKVEDKEDEKRDLSPDYLSGEESDDSSTAVSGGDSDEKNERGEGSS